MTSGIDKLLYEALQAGDRSRFARLLHDYPDNLVDPDDGTCTWLSMAARDGHVTVVELLVEEFGVDVNQPESDIAGPEGAIIEAARNGHLDVVRWMLDNGAHINHEVNGKVRCLPLTGAARKGHLDVVKLLVERGADLDASWHGTNALVEAETYGKTEVAEYLRSVGMEYVPVTPDYPASHDAIRRILSGLRGELSDLRIEVPGDPAVTIHSTRPSERWNSQTVFTVGTSDKTLALPDDVPLKTELMFTLPPDWPLDAAALADPLWNWPVEWLKRICREVLEAGTWPGEAALFPNGDPPAPFAPNTRLCAWLCLYGEGNNYQMPDHRWIDVRTLFAIFEEELRLVETAGHEALVRRFEERNVPLYVDPDRVNVAV